MVRISVAFVIIMYLLVLQIECGDEFQYEFCLNKGKQKWLELMPEKIARYRCMQQCADSSKEIRDYYQERKSRKPMNCSRDKLPPLVPACARRYKNIQLTQRGKNFYIFSEIKLSWLGARKWCRSNGLDFGDIEDWTKRFELNEYFAIGSSYEAIKNRNIKSKLWLAASDFSKPNRTTWDNSGRQVNLKIAPIKAAKAKCVVVSAKYTRDTLEFTQDNCTSANYFYCTIPKRCFVADCFALYNFYTARAEVPTFRNLVNFKKLKIASTIYPCERNDWNTRISNRTVVPEQILGEELSACNRKLFFGSQMKPFAESYDDCRLLDMNLISIPTKEKLNCIANLFKGVTNQLPTAFYTSGFDELTCEGSYSWLGSKDVFKPNEVPWLIGEPSQEGEFVVAVYISSTVNGLLDWQIMNPLRYICERELKYSEKTMNTDEYIKSTLINLETIKAPDFNPPEKIKSMKRTPICGSMRYNLEKKKKYIVDPAKIVQKNLGHLITACGRQYVFSHRGSEKAMMHEHCWDVGMQVAVIETTEELNCIADAFLDLGLPGMVYAISIVDENLDRKFTNCDQDFTPIDDKLWFVGEPNNGAKVRGIHEFCGVVRLSPSGIRGFADRNCICMYNFLCEEIPTYNGSTSYAKKKDYGKDQPSMLDKWNPFKFMG